MFDHRGSPEDAAQRQSRDGGESGWVALAAALLSLLALMVVLLPSADSGAGTLLVLLAQAIPVVICVLAWRRRRSSGARVGAGAVLLAWAVVGVGGSSLSDAALKSPSSQVVPRKQSERPALDWSQYSEMSLVERQDARGAEPSSQDDDRQIRQPRVQVRVAVL